MNQIRQEVSLKQSPNALISEKIHFSVGDCARQRVGPPVLLRHFSTARLAVGATGELHRRYIRWIRASQGFTIVPLNI